MSRNILFCSIGVILGFVVGFFVANGVSRPLAPASTASTANTAAGPLDSSDSALPPDHPDIGGASGGANRAGAAATSPEAQAAMEKADRNAKDFDAQMNAAQTFSRLEDFAKASLYLERALALKPTDFEALRAMGNTKYDGGDFVAAASFYERALAVKPDDPDIRTDLGNTYFRRTPPDFARAIVEYRKSVAIDATHETTWKNIAAAALNLGDKATASEAVERLAKLNARSPELEEYRQKLAALP
jgi:tetratricopeptide (TPR) repeat protein